MQSQIALRAWGFATALGGGQPEPGPPTRPPLGHERRALRGLVASARRGLVHCPGRGRIRSRETRRSPRIRSRARIRFVHERGCVTLGPARGRADSRTTTTPPDIREKPGCRTGRIDSFRDTNGCGPKEGSSPRETRREGFGDPGRAGRGLPLERSGLEVARFEHCTTGTGEPEERVESTLGGPARRVRHVPRAALRDDVPGMAAEPAENIGWGRRVQ